MAHDSVMIRESQARSERAGARRSVQQLVPLVEAEFDDRADLERVWGRPWGASTEVGALRSVLLRRPGTELRAIDASRFDDGLGAAVDPQGRWYWFDREPPDLDRIHEQHDGLVALLRDEGIETHVLPPLEGVFTKSMYVRDPFITVAGGVIVGRLAPEMRHGEEAAITRSLANLGLPILGTVVGRGYVEGGSFVKLTPDVALFGTGIRCNDEGAAQLSALLARSGIELVTVPQSGFALHLDGALAMLDVDKALLQPDRLPFWMTELLESLGIEVLVPEPDEPWALNCLALAPGRVLLSTSAPRTAAVLRQRGVDVIEIPYDEIERNGGGVHCSTNELLRDEP